MPRKKAPKLTTEEAIRRIFGKKGAKLLKRTVEELDAEKDKKRKKKRAD